MEVVTLLFHAQLGAITSPMSQPLAGGTEEVCVTT
jgi:hypothetical protein